MTTKALHTVLC